MGKDPPTPLFVQQTNQSTAQPAFRQPQGFHRNGLDPEAGRRGRIATSAARSSSRCRSIVFPSGSTDCNCGARPAQASRRHRCGGLSVAVPERHRKRRASQAQATASLDSSGIGISHGGPVLVGIVGGPVGVSAPAQDAELGQAHLGLVHAHGALHHAGGDLVSAVAVATRTSV